LMIGGPGLFDVQMLSQILSGKYFRLDPMNRPLSDGNGSDDEYYPPYASTTTALEYWVGRTDTLVQSLVSSGAWSSIIQAVGSALVPALGLARSASARAIANSGGNARGHDRAGDVVDADDVRAQEGGDRHRGGRGLGLAATEFARRPNQQRQADRVLDGGDAAQQLEVLGRRPDEADPGVGDEPFARHPRPLRPLGHLQ